MSLPAGLARTTGIILLVISGLLVSSGRWVIPRAASPRPAPTRGDTMGRPEVGSALRILYLPRVAGPAGGATSTPTPAPTASPTPLASDLLFLPDPGVRVMNASNPAASYDPAEGAFYLFYQDRSSDGPGARLVATSRDGLSFSPGHTPTPTDMLHHPYHVHLPNGTWRKYFYDAREGGVRSESSRDGMHFSPDPGLRYTLWAGDHGTMGVHDEYVDPAGGVVLLYVGDMGGLNNVRRAYSPPGDNGWTFHFEDANVLGDADAGGHGYSFVDPKSLLLPDGRRRLIVMRQGPLPPQPGYRTVGEIHSFISEDGKTYEKEPGIRLLPEDFTEFTVWSLNDPVVVRLPDGRYRMYVAALIGDVDARPAIVSATTPP